MSNSTAVAATIGVRRIDGYDDEGKKKYKRFFLVKKFKSVQAQTV